MSAGVAVSVIGFATTFLAAAAVAALGAALAARGRDAAPGSR
jgi:hypothetical protein